MKDALEHMKTPVPAVAAAVSMYYKGMSISDIRQELKQLYNLDRTDFAVYNWVERFTKDAVNETNHYRPDVGYVWLADETVIPIAGKDYWFLDVIDVKTRFLIASKLSPTRRVEDIQDVLKEAYARTGRIPKVIMTDHLWAYIYGIKLTFGDQSKHLQVKKFTARPNNNIIERMQGTIKERTKVMRDLKSPNTAQILLDGFLVNYNYFRPHDTLKMTPASKAHVQFPYSNWETLIRRVPDAKTTEPRASFGIPPLPFVKLTPREQKQAELRLRKRRKLETKRTGIPYQPKSKGGGRRPIIKMQAVPPLRNYEDY
ncbi:MAG: IS6 family transposase [Dehalococcoidia bacterium]|jgi:transposase-like protein